MFKRLLAIIMILSLLSGVVIVNAAPAGEVGDIGWDSGGSYNQETGEADIITDTQTGKIKNKGGIGDWRVKTPAKWPNLKGNFWGFTPTQYEIEYNGKHYDAGIYSERDWSTGTKNGTYRHTPEMIEELVNNAVNSSIGRTDRLNADVIWDNGFRVHIYVGLFAIEPGEPFEDGSIDLYIIAGRINELMYQNGISGARTWIANVVDRAARNLGVDNNGHAYYDVPPRNNQTPTPTPTPTPVVNSSNIKGDLVLSEKRISKAYDLNSLGGGLVDFNFTYSSAGYHSHRVNFRNDNGTPLDKTDDFDDYYYDDYNRTTAIDSSYKYVIQTSNTLNTKAIASGGRFNLKYVNNTKTGTANWSGGSSTLTPNLQFSVWRANDLPTLASYKENANNPLVKDLGLPIGKTPQKPRNTTGGYQENISIQLRQSNDDGADYSTTFTDGDDSATQIHSTVDTADYNAILGVQSL